MFHSLNHSATAVGRKLELIWIEAGKLSEETEEGKEAWEKIKACDGILVPGGFGDRGTEGKILAVNYARTQKIPYLGICLGMQIAVIEYSRNMLGLKDANSAEFNPESENKVVIEMLEHHPGTMGGTMRLGKRISILTPGSLASKMYNDKTEIWERHRHRYEVNPDYVKKLEIEGLKFTGRDDEGERMEVIEIEDHPFFFGVQFHPEFKSKPFAPSPPFYAFLAAASSQLNDM